MPKVNRQAIVTLLAFWTCHVAIASEPYTLANVPDPVPLSADEPFAKEFSLAKGTEALDITALDWQKTAGLAYRAPHCQHGHGVRAARTPRLRRDPLTMS